MEINFENKMQGICRELNHQLKTVQESLESVVPDTEDDIGKIASVQSRVLLKSKDIIGRGVKITAEACAQLLYINENEDRVSGLSLKKSFELEYELENSDADLLTLIKLSVSNAEARILNPRKVSVVLEICGELSCYKNEVISVSSELPKALKHKIHVKNEDLPLLLADNVCEKSFAVNEQFTFPAGKPVPRELVFQNPRFSLLEFQHIGSKTVIKGRMELDCCYLSDEVNYPVKTIFSSSFSQIIDSGEEETDSCSAVIQLNSAYYELLDSINGEKVLEAELHGLIQLVCRSRKDIAYISDAYCNAMPSVCSMKTEKLTETGGEELIKISAEEQLSAVEDCDDLLWVWGNLNQPKLNKEKFTAVLNLDIIYLNKEGKLSAARRLINIEKELNGENASVSDCCIMELDIKPEGESSRCNLELELKVEKSCQRELCRAEKIELIEDKAYEQSSFPSLSMVRKDGESLWELAKMYHSSVESIEFMNPQEKNTEAALLLIAKEN